MTETPLKPVELKHTDWLKIASAAGLHGVRYRTNSALLQFLAEITPITRTVDTELLEALKAVDAGLAEHGYSVSGNMRQLIAAAITKAEAGS